MKKIIALGFLATVPFIASPSFAQQANSEKVTFNSDREFSGNKLLAQLYGGNVPGAQSALVDLNGDKSAELVVRFGADGKGCENGCDTAVLAYANGRWKEIIRRKAESVSLLKNSETDPLRDVVVTLPYAMGDEIWKWSGNGYKPSMEALGTTVDMPLVTKGKAFSIVSEDMKNDVTKVRGTRNGEPAFYATEMDVNGDGKKDVVAQVRHQALCSPSLGCPTAVYLQSQDGAWSKVLDGRSLERVVVSKNAGKDGFRDVLVSGEEGYSRLAWNGRWYEVYDTSFPSSEQRR